MNAEITLKQIGTLNLMAIGARAFVKDGKNALIMRVGSGSKLAKVVITLDADDTYSVRYVVMSSRALKITHDETLSGVYCDSLGQVVRSMVR